MCQLCVDLVHEILPSVPDDMMGQVLYETTNFPFGKPEDLEPQLRAIARLSRDMGLPVIETAYRLCDADMELYELIHERDWQ